MPIIYRVIKYEGSNEWLDNQLDRSMRDGIVPYRIIGGTITVASVDPLDLPTIEFCRDQIRRMTARVVEETEKISK